MHSRKLILFAALLAICTGQRSLALKAPPQSVLDKVPDGYYIEVDDATGAGEEAGQTLDTEPAPAHAETDGLPNRNDAEYHEHVIHALGHDDDEHEALHARHGHDAGIPLPHNGAHSRTAEFKRLARAVGDVALAQHLQAGREASPQRAFEQLDMDVDGAINLHEVGVTVGRGVYLAQTRNKFSAGLRSDIEALRAVYLSKPSNAKRWSKHVAREESFGHAAAQLTALDWLTHSGLVKTWHSLHDSNGDGLISRPEFGLPALHTEL